MSQDRAIRYTIHKTLASGAHHTPCEWQVRTLYGVPGLGKPTDAKLARWVEEFEASTRAGGVNAHLGAETVLMASVYDHSEGWGVATYQRTKARP